MDMPTTCQLCLEVVEFNDMVDVSKCGASIFVCSDCAEDEGDTDG
jgi:hypothetical protein